MLTEQGQYEKIEEFGLMPFPVNVLHANRTFCESFVVGKSVAWGICAPGFLAFSHIVENVDCVEGFW